MFHPISLSISSIKHPKQSMPLKQFLRQGMQRLFAISQPDKIDIYQHDH